MLAAVVWHFWLGLALFVASLGLVAQTLVGYVTKVSATRHPNREQRRASRR